MYLYVTEFIYLNRWTIRVNVQINKTSFGSNWICIHLISKRLQHWYMIPEDPKSYRQNQTYRCLYTCNSIQNLMHYFDHTVTHLCIYLMMKISLWSKFGKWITVHNYPNWIIVISIIIITYYYCSIWNPNFFLNFSGNDDKENIIYIWNFIHVSVVPLQYSISECFFFNWK